MIHNWKQSIQLLLAHEGGYVNHPSDPGGATNYGITIHDYRRYIKPRGTPADVKAMPLSAAIQIYRQKYWEAQRCDELPDGVDFAIFDYGVNSGIGRSAKVLQRILGVPADAKIGPKTIAAAHARREEQLIDAICDERLNFLQRLKTWRVFGKGWTRRVVETRAAAKKMITHKQR